MKEIRINETCERRSRNNMRILLSNDDGVHAAGIRALAMALKKEHQLTIAAPDSEQRREPFVYKQQICAYSKKDCA